MKKDLSSVKTVDLKAAAGQTLAELFSPAFFQPSPAVQNLHLVPDDVLQAMHAGWHTGQHMPRPFIIRRLSDVYVTEEGLVFTRDNELIIQTIAQHSAAECQRAYERVLSKTESVPEEKPSLLLRKRGDHNYGHWLVELLPRLWRAERVGSYSCLVVPQVSGAMQAVIRDSVALSSPRYYQYLSLGNDEVRYFRTLTLVEGLTDHGVYMSPLCFERNEQMSAAMFSGSPLRLYIARPGSRRSLAHEEQIQALLIRYGFITVDPAALTLLEQIKLFRNAACVVGVMGAGMSSIVFCAAGTKVGILAPATMPDTFYAFIAGIRGLTYQEIRGETEPPSTTWDVPFVILPEQLEALLRQWAL
ncbi:MULTISPECIES: glycosyltransferase family 61 protein [Acetobacter]|uniref:glycosyltransferase family 61 protein n=1 Tax=Acetobacter TaxID=434 RepID=UPI000A3635C2|nr:MULTISPECIES: glycosyltransferase family 61 protein [Acetobacter]MBS0986291.1 glycosyltransferase family 61 protein [Acetobacter thailandicus]OUJ12130.1 hypothetical protein HK25_00045 [Acetobacter sp. DsW_059]